MEELYRILLQSSISSIVPSRALHRGEATRHIDPDLPFPEGTPELRPISTAALRRRWEEDDGRAKFLLLWASWYPPAVELLCDLARIVSQALDIVDPILLSVDPCTEPQIRLVRHLLAERRIPLDGYIHHSRFLVSDIRNYDRLHELMEGLACGYRGGLPYAALHDRCHEVVMEGADLAGMVHLVSDWVIDRRR